MTASIHQPDYLPWLAYFDKMKRADVFVLLDRAQYAKNKFQNRNKIKTANGWTYLTIPIPRTEDFKNLNEVALPQDSSWQKKHWRAIYTSYARAPYFKEHRDFFEKLYNSQYQHLAGLNIEIIKYLKEQFGFKTKLILESEMKIDKELKATERLAAILRELGARNYISGRSGRKYLDLALFNKANIKVEFQDYQHPQYKQLFGQFIPGLSAIDLLFNEGPRAGEII